MHARQSPPRRGWAIASGILTGCGITLLGVALNLQPETILIRACVGSAAVAALTAIWSLTWQLIFPPLEEE